MHDKQHYSTRDFSYALNTHVSYVRKAINDGDIEAEKDGKGRWRIAHNELERWRIWADAGRVPSQSPAALRKGLSQQ